MTNYDNATLDKMRRILEGGIDPDAGAMLDLLKYTVALKAEREALQASGEILSSIVYRYRQGDEPEMEEWEQIEQIGAWLMQSTSPLWMEEPK